MNIRNLHIFCLFYREFFNVLVYKFQAETFMKQNETGIVIAMSALIQVMTKLYL